MTPQQLKNSILQLAIQGRLVPQIPSEGTGEELYRAIQKEKQALIKAGKIKREKPLPPIAEDEIPFEIPDGWRWCRLREVAILHNGRAYKQNEMLEHGKYPLLRVGNLFTSEKWYYSNLELEDEKYCQDGDLLYSWSASFGPHLWKGSKVIYHYHIWKVEHSKHIHQNYLYYFFMADTERMKSMGHGLAMIHITKAGTEERLIPLPPLAEQQRIVAKIEELMPLIDRYGKAWTELEALNKRFPGDLKRSILQEAIQGRLVPQIPSEGTGEELYQAIQKEKQALIKTGKIKKEKPLPPIAEDEIPFEIPDGWRWCRLREIVILNPKNDLPDDLDTAFIPMALISDGYKNEHSFKIRKWHDIKNKYTHFSDGDIGVAKITPCFQNKKSVIFSNLPNNHGAGTTELSIIRVIGDLLIQKFVLFFLKSDFFISNGVNSFTGTAGQQRIHKDYLAHCVFPLPPLAEQRRIVAKIEELMPLISQLQPHDP